MKVLKIVLYVLFTLLIITVLFINVSPQFGSNPSRAQKKFFSSFKNFEKGEFKNNEPTELFTDKMNFWDFFKTELNRVPIKEIIPVNVDLESFVKENIEQIKIVWLGHSAFLINVNGSVILLDPMLGSHAAPLPVPSLKRYSSKIAFDIDELEVIDFVVFSHDHYDHLDYPTIRKIKSKVKNFIVPHGIGNHLKNWGVRGESIIELNWDESFNYNSIEFVCLPARHFSGRGPLNRNSTLWSSWAIKADKGKIYFSGDSGYGSHFKKIGQEHGPFDFSLIDCGQYNKAWKFSHMFPEQAVNAALDLNTKYLIPIHWGAFTLASHSWIEPPEIVSKEAKKLNQDFMIPEIGQVLFQNRDNKIKTRWWLEFSQSNEYD